MKSQAQSTLKPDFSHEQALINDGIVPIAGIDEAGRGPWAGPVVAAAVILDPSAIPDGLNDSKKLSSQRREQLFEQLKAHAQIGIGIGDVERIDRDNILRATFWAMEQALENLPRSPAHVLVDGRQLPHLPCPGTALIKGDGRSLSIAAASICAKVTRDKIMCDLADQFPDYGWERNMGYGTKAHQSGLAQFGVTQHHRRSFKPLRALLDPNQTC